MLRRIFLVLSLVLSTVLMPLPGASPTAYANNTVQPLPFAQDWSNTGLITANDDWSGVPGIIGYLGDYTAALPTGVDPQTLVTMTLTTVDVIANQLNPNTATAGGVAEFESVTNTIALQGSGTADAPFVLFHVNTTGLMNINVAYNVRDIDGSIDNAVQQVALHYRIGSSGDFTNVPAAYIADATVGPSALMTTSVSITLPVDANNQAEVQIRVLTTNAVGSDEWVGIDDINITGSSISPEADLALTKTGPATATAGDTATYTVTLSNVGSVTATTTLLTDTLPSATTFVTYTASAPVTFTQTLNTLEWEVGDVVAGSGALTITVQATISATLGATTLTNTVTASTAVTETVLGNNTASAATVVTPLQPDLEISLSAPSAVIVNDPLTYTLLVSNTGTANTSSVSVTFTLPITGGAYTYNTAAGTHGFSGSESGGEVTFSGGALDTGDLATLTVSITPTVVGTLGAGPATVDPANTILELDENNNSSSTVATDVNPQSADLTVSLSDAPDPVSFGNGFTYTLNANNIGGSEAPTVTVVFTLPASGYALGAIEGGTFGAVESGGVVTFTGALSATASAELTVAITPTVEGVLTSGSALIDPENVIAEGNEANNSAAPVTTTVNGANDGDGTASVVNGVGVLQGLNIFQRTLSSTVDVRLTGVITGPLGQATLTFPAGFDLSAATASLNGAGISGGSATIAGQVISLTNLALTSVATGTVSLTGVVMPDPTALTDDGLYTVTVQTARTSGTLTNLANQPRLYVTIPITNLRDVDAAGIPLDITDTVVIEGVGTSIVSYSGATGLNFYMQDASAGMNIFRSGAAFASAMSNGNTYLVKGTVARFNGLSEIVPVTTTDIITMGVGSVVPPPATLTIADILANPEGWEGSLVRIISATKTSGTWPGAGANATLTISDSTGSLGLFIDLDTNIDGTPEPGYPIEVVGHLGQFDSSNPYTSGYQIIPRATSDITGTGGIFTNTIGVTYIYSAQGSSLVSPFNGSIITTTGVVVGDVQTSAAMNGFFIQDPVGDGLTTTSDGLFVYIPAANPFYNVNVVVGDLVTVTGRVNEFNTLTQLDFVSALSVTTVAATILPTVVTLPEATNGDLERYEGMYISIPHSLTVQQNFFLGQYGQLTLASGARLYNPTNLYTPTSALAIALADENARRLLTLDDSNNNQNPAVVPYLGLSNTVRAGDVITGLMGVLDVGIINPSGTLDYRLQPIVTSTIVFDRANVRTTVPEAVGGNVQVASFNVLNYFNGNGFGGGFPTSRGASTLAEFNRQNAKIITALVALDADVVGLMEMENDANTTYPALNELVDRVNTVLGSSVYTYVVNPGGVGLFGTDEIRVALLYKPSVVTLVGASQTDVPNAAAYSRPPLAQTFSLNSNGEQFTVVVNHFKSKGCSGASGLDLDQGDGQGCFNARRTVQAQAMVTFTIALAASDPDVLIIGDLNAYGLEDPIRILTGAGNVNQLSRFITNPYSYVFDGQAGYLDHALASPALSAQATLATEWHINADEPSALDYNTEFNPPSLYQPDAFRASDHDPVLVGFVLTPTVPPTPANFSGSMKTVNTTTVTAGELLTYTLTLSNSGETTGTYFITDTLDAALTLISAPGLTVNGQTLTATGSLAGGAQTTFIITVQVAITASGAMNNTAQLSGDGQTRALDAPTVTVVPVYRLFLPLIRK